MTYIKEEWKPVVGYEGWYEVSNQGRVKRSRWGKGTHPGKILKFRIAGRGYKQVSLSRHGIIKGCYVHDLVAAAFIGLKRDNMTVNHCDTNKDNCHASNLEYLTGIDNYRHAVDRGLIPRGERCGAAKLTACEVLEIRKLYGRHTLEDLAETYGVTFSNISRIILRQTWRHI